MNKFGARRDAQAVERAGVRVGLAGGGVAGDDARDVRAVTVAVRAVRKCAVKFEIPSRAPASPGASCSYRRYPGRCPPRTPSRPDPSKPICSVTVGVPTLPSSPPTIFDAASSTSLRLGAGSIQSTELDCASAGKFGEIQFAPQNGAQTQIALVLDGRKQRFARRQFPPPSPPAKSKYSRRQSAPGFSATRRSRRRTIGIQSCNPADNSPPSGRSPAP